MTNKHLSVGDLVRITTGEHKDKIVAITWIPDKYYAVDDINFVEVDLGPQEHSISARYYLIRRKQLEVIFTI